MIGVTGILILIGLSLLAVNGSLVILDQRSQQLWGLAQIVVSRFKTERGVDLREAPPYPARIPRWMAGLVLLVGAVVVVAHVCIPSGFPHGLRTAVVAKSASLYLLGITGVWAWAVVLGTGATFLGWLHVNDHLAADGVITRRDNAIRIALPIGAIGWASLAATVVPPWVPSFGLTIGLCIGLISLCFRATGSIAFLWRERGKPDVYSINSRWVYAWNIYLSLGMTLATTMLMTRSGWSGEPGGPTVWLGSATGWLCVFASSTWLWVGPIRLIRLSWHDLAGVRLTPLRFVGIAPPDQVVHALELRGFRVLDDHAADQGIALRVDPGTSRHGIREGPTAEGRQVWIIHPDDLLSSESLAELRAIERRSVRREVFRAVDELMRLARTRRFSEGSGFWFAPHLWYVWAVSRDTHDADTITVGLPYHRMLSLDARRHCYEVFRGTSVDIVFIQDGVSERSIRAVLMQVFEHFDVWGIQPFEERHVQIVPGVRIIIHDVAPDSRFEHNGYREPDYEDIGRARILHIMVDRGGDEAPAGDPHAHKRYPSVRGIPVGSV